jgi:two-component system, LuxR family, response regulator FixJ
MLEARESFAVYVIDDDAAIRDSLALLLGLRGYRAALFASAEDFLAAFQPGWRGCVLTDLRLPGMSGLELQRELQARGVAIPVVIITGHGDIAAARAAFKADAVDFLEKPFDDDGPIVAIEAAFEREAARVAGEAASVHRGSVWASLTERERTVASLVIEGLHNREIGERLGISPRTVEVHKSRLMEKVGARNRAELIRLAKGAPK